MRMIYGNYIQADRVNNTSFAPEDLHHKHNPTFAPRTLRETFLKYGIEINTPDVNDRLGYRAQFNLYLDGQLPLSNTLPNYLIATENPIINPLNANRNYLQQFTHIFTWNPTFSSLPNASLLFIPNQIHRFTKQQTAELFFPTPFLPFSKRSIFACLINANKAFAKPIPNDLYQERVAVIRWYEEHAPTHFALYGLGWHKPTHQFTWHGKLMRRGQRLATQLWGYRPYPSYHGDVIDKAMVYSKAKFAYCYENIGGLPNYVSEKIFDAFLSGCVPIYWGADNVNDLIPASCFIDRRDFKSNQAVHQYLLNISEQQYAQYQQHIVEFLHSAAANRFDISHYTKIIVSEITKSLTRRSVPIGQR